MVCDFKVDYFSDTRYEKITAEISFAGKILCQINIDKGIHAVEVKLFTDERILSGKLKMKFSLDDIIRVLTETKLAWIAEARPL